MRNRHLLIAASVVVAMAAVVAVVSAGQPDSPPGPPESASSYTLEDIYERLSTGAAGTQITFTEPVSGPETGTMHTLNAIMAVAPAVNNTYGATASIVLSGTTFWGLTSGQWGAMTGAMADNGAVEIMPTTVSQTIAAGYHDGMGIVVGDADLAAGNIRNGVNIFGVTGTYETAIGLRIPKTGQTQCWDAAGALISCVDTGQDGEYQKGVTPAVPPDDVNPYTAPIWIGEPFTDNGDGTVTDNLTGLVWLRSANCAGGTTTWAIALSYSNALYDGCTDCFGTSGDCGLSDGSSAGDWRLPNLNELRSLIDPTESNPALSAGHPFSDVQSSTLLYWSSTTHSDVFSSLAWEQWASRSSFRGGGDRCSPGRPHRGASSVF